MSREILSHNEIIYVAPTIDDPNEPTPGEEVRIIERDIDGYFKAPRGREWQLVERYAGHVVFARPKGLYTDTEQETSDIIGNLVIRYIQAIVNV